MVIADEYLRHGSPPAPGLHFGALFGRRFDIDFLDGHFFRIQQTARPFAIRTPVRGVEGDLRTGHHAALATGRFSARQPAKPPRSVKALVNPCALSWRTAAAASEPDSQYTITGFSLNRLKFVPALRIWS